MRILVFGDSIAQGFWDANGGWVQYIRAQYDQQMLSGQNEDPPALFNLGISGDTTSMLLKRFVNETEARHQAGNQLLLVFAIGTNDTIYRGSTNDSEPSTYAQQLMELVSMARKYTDKILFVGFFPVVDSILQPMPWSSTGKCYSTERIELFDQTLKQFTREQKLPVVDLYSQFEPAKLNDLLFDGIHPNQSGHQLIARLVKPELDKLIDG